MPVPRFMANQLAQPKGLFGRYVMGGLLNRKTQAHNAMVLDELALGDADRVLEVGFGGAALLENILHRTPRGFVAGVDLSDAMVTRARYRLRGAVVAGRLNLRQGRADALPFPDGHFNRACAVNTLYFWPDLVSIFAELGRVIQPGGRLVLGFVSDQDVRGARLDRQGFTPYTNEQVEAALDAAGFVPGWVRSGVDARGTFHVLPAQRTAG